jgi:hypothetical protein
MHGLTVEALRLVRYRLDVSAAPGPVYPISGWRVTSVAVAGSELVYRGRFCYVANLVLRQNQTPYLETSRC